MCRKRNQRKESKYRPSSASFLVRKPTILWSQALVKWVPGLCRERHKSALRWWSTPILPIIFSVYLLQFSYDKRVGWAASATNLSCMQNRSLLTQKFKELMLKILRHSRIIAPILTVPYLTLHTIVRPIKKSSILHLQISQLKSRRFHNFLLWNLNNSIQLLYSTKKTTR